MSIRALAMKTPAAANPVKRITLKKAPFNFAGLPVWSNFS